MGMVAYVEAEGKDDKQFCIGSFARYDNFRHYVLRVICGREEAEERERKVKLAVHMLSRMTRDRSMLELGQFASVPDTVVPAVNIRCTDEDRKAIRMFVSKRDSQDRFSTDECATLLKVFRKFKKDIVDHHHLQTYKLFIRMFNLAKMRNGKLIFP